MLALQDYYKIPVNILMESISCKNEQKRMKKRRLQNKDADSLFVDFKRKKIKRCFIILILDLEVMVSC